MLVLYSSLQSHYVKSLYDIQKLWIKNALTHSKTHILNKEKIRHMMKWLHYEANTHFFTYLPSTQLDILYTFWFTQHSTTAYTHREIESDQTSVWTQQKINESFHHLTDRRPPPVHGMVGGWFSVSGVGRDHRTMT